MCSSDLSTAESEQSESRKRLRTENHKTGCVYPFRFAEEDFPCVGYFNYAFVPLDFNSPGIWAGNTSEGSGKYEGKLMCYREFVLQLQEDGNWHCTGLGTGGYTLPE